MPLWIIKPAWVRRLERTRGWKRGVVGDVLNYLALRNYPRSENLAWHADVGGMQRGQQHPYGHVPAHVLEALEKEGFVVEEGLNDSLDRRKTAFERHLCFVPPLAWELASTVYGFLRERGVIVPFEKLEKELQKVLAKLAVSQSVFPRSLLLHPEFPNIKFYSDIVPEPKGEAFYEPVMKLHDYHPMWLMGDDMDAFIKQLTKFRDSLGGEERKAFDNLPVREKVNLMLLQDESNFREELTHKLFRLLFLPEQGMSHRHHRVFDKKKDLDPVFGKHEGKSRAEHPRLKKEAEQLKRDLMLVSEFVEARLGAAALKEFLALPLPEKVAWLKKKKLWEDVEILFLERDMGYILRPLFKKNNVLRVVFSQPVPEVVAEQ